MSFETAPLRGVSNQYGTRKVGGFQGSKKTSGLTYEATINFDGDNLPIKVVVPAGAIVTHVNSGFISGTVSTATVGAVDVSGADGAELNYVDVPAGGDLTITGPTGGSVIVEYQFTASSQV